MKKLAFFVLILSFPFLLSGCSLAEKLKEAGKTVVSEVSEAYSNVKNFFVETKEGIEEKVGKIEKAAESTKEAAESVSEAVKDIKAISEGEEENASP